MAAKFHCKVAPPAQRKCKAGGSLYVQGGSDFGAVVSGGGLEVVLEGSATGTQVQSGGILDDVAVTSNAVVSDGGAEIVFNGGSAIGTQVQTGGMLIVAPGGNATGESGGGAVVSSGVVALQEGGAAILNPVSGTVLGANAVEYVLTSGVAQGAVLNGAEQYLMAGVASDTVVNSGAAQVVSGGTAYDTVVNCGGTETVEAAYPFGGGEGVAYDTTIAGGTLVLAFGGAISGGVSFSGSGGVLDISGATLTADTAITGFAAGDAIDLESVQFTSGTSVSLSGAVLSIADGGNGVSLDLTGDAGAVFEVSADGRGGTEITVAPLCFCAGTRIATPSGEIAVEALQIGDRVETLHGGVRPVKWIGRRSYDAAFLALHEEMRPIRIARDAIEDGVPARDLLVSAGHGICLEGGLVPAFRLINGVTILRDEVPEPTLYYHVELDEHEVLLAEGCPAESFFEDDFRGHFENADEYRALYPEARPEPAVRCLPRLEDGFVLQAIQRRLAERAGLPHAEVLNGPLRGFVDRVGPAIVSGWAQCTTQPEEPVCLDILVDGKRLLRALANRYREDLHQAGLGSGNHSFEVHLPQGTTGPIEVRRTFDQAPLSLTDTAARLRAAE